MCKQTGQRSENSIRKTIQTDVKHTGAFYKLFAGEFTIWIYIRLVELWNLINSRATKSH
jgi:hypothetical protein